MAKYDHNQVCENCRPYVDGYVQQREQEVSAYVGKAGPAMSVYKFLMDEDDPKSGPAYLAVKAAMEGKPSQSAAPEKAGSRSDDDPVMSRLNELDLRDQMRDFKAQYPHLKKEQINKVFEYYKTPGRDDVPLEEAAWAVLKTDMNPSASKVEHAPDYEPATGEEPGADGAVRFKENEPSGARREVERAINKDWAEATRSLA